MLTLPSCVRRPCTLLYYGKERKSKPAKPHIRSADVSDPLLIFTMNISLSAQSEMGLLKRVNSKQTTIISNKGVRVEGFDVSCLRYTRLGNETWSWGILEGQRVILHWCYSAGRCFGLETASVLFGNRVTFICVYLPCQLIPERLLKGFVLKSSDSGFFY